MTDFPQDCIGQHGEGSTGMKYVSVDHIDDFEFHDAELTLISWDGDCLRVSAGHLNIHKDAAPDNMGCDMEIAEACITFRGFQLKEFEPSRAWKKDADGQLRTDEPRVVYTGDKARDLLTAELRDTFTVWRLDSEDGLYTMTAAGNDPCFSVRFTFSSLETEWDAYRKKAWYVLHRQYEKQVTIETESGAKQLDVRVICHDEDVYTHDGKTVPAPSVTVVIRCDGKEYYSN